MPDLHVVEKMKKPNLDDIPTMLRRMADNIENAKLVDVNGRLFTPEGVIVVAVRGVGQWPEVYGYGEYGAPMVELQAAYNKLFQLAFPPERF